MPRCDEGVLAEEGGYAAICLKHCVRVDVAGTSLTWTVLVLVCPWRAV